MTQQKIPFRSPYRLGGCVYYSQNREDLILESFFPDVKEGFYVDIGAFDPNVDSVTKLFYEKGWRGVNIEPQPDRYRLFEEERPRDINLNFGVGDAEGEFTLRSYKNQGLSTLSEEVKNNLGSDSDSGETKEYSDIKIQIRQLESVFRENNLSHVHFMKIDVEGFEYEVIKGNDWNVYRPEVLCIEADHIEKDWRPILRKQGYKFIFHDGLNEYYTDSHTSRNSKFNYVQDIVTNRGGGIRWEHYDEMAQLYEYSKQKTNHVEELTKANRELNAKLNEFDRIKPVVMQLARLVKKKVAIFHSNV